MARFTAFLLLVALVVCVAPLKGQTVITGNYNGNTGGKDGYDINSPGTYIVSADLGGTPSATFNNNSGSGLVVTTPTSGVIVNVAGGQFDGNSDAGLGVSGSVNVTGGTFANNGISGVDYDTLTGSLTLTGGTITGNHIGVRELAGTTSVYGGVFSNNTFDFGSEITLDVYGGFSGLSIGQTQTLSANTGTFFGRLQNDAAPQTFSYVTNGGSIILHDTTPVPEPNAVGLLVVAGAGFTARRRRNKLASA